jgi:hypothetical protein
MPKNQVSDPITDQEVAFAHLILSGTMNDRQAAKAVGFNPDTAANTKSKPRVRDYMLKHRAGIHEQSMQQETEELRRGNLSRQRVLDRLWEIADLDPEMTRNSMSAQIKALSMIVAIEGLIPDRNTDRRAGSAQNKSTSQPVHPQIDTAARLREQQANTTGFEPRPDPVQDEDEPRVPDPQPGEAADAPSHLGSTPAPDSHSSRSIFARPSKPSEAAPSASPAPVSASAPGTRVPPSTEKKPDTWRLRLS